MQRHALGVLFHASIGAVALSFTGCQGCLGLDDYTLVPAGAGGTGGSTNTGGGPACNVPGTLFVTAAQPATTKTDDTGQPCSITEPLPLGIEIQALDPEQRTCVARARIAGDPMTLLESPPRIQVSLGTSVLVAVIYRNGSLTMPGSCDTGETQVIKEEDTAEESLLIAKLERKDSGFCTDWARRAYTTDMSAAKRLRVQSIREDENGDVAVVGSFGGAQMRFEDGSAFQDLTGGAFFARYLKDGSIGEITVLNGTDTSDSVMDAVRSAGRWLLTGTVLDEQPACYGCAGTVAVTEPAQASCPGAGAGGTGTGGAGGASTGGPGGAGGAGTGGVGGAGTGGIGGAGTGGVGGAGTGGVGGAGTGGVGGAGTGGAGGAGTGGGGGGGPVSDSQNAFLWLLETGGVCSDLSTYGSDRLGITDRQSGFSMSVMPSQSGCALTWAGLAARDPWLLEKGTSNTALFDAGGTSMDGFLAHSEGSSITCSGSPGPVWNMRMTPLAANAAAVAERVAVDRCDAPFGEVTASAFVRSPGGGTLALYRCTTSDGCDMDSSLVPLASGADEQLVIMGMRADGSPSWSAAFGPVAADPDAAEGSFHGRSHHDLVKDNRDSLYTIFETSGPLTIKNVETFNGCDGLVDNLAEGTYLVSLREYASGEAMCEWFYRVGP